MLPLTLLLASASLSESPSPALPAFPNCTLPCAPLNDPAPFLRLPRITPVEECRSSESAEACKSESWTHTFHRAARFNVPRFDLNQEPMEGDALVIYEGMRLTVNEKTGIYDLSFTATVPTRPVTVRLQLVFKENPYGKEIKLTLPPIRLDNDESLSSGDNSGKTVRIQHRGFSELFQNVSQQSGSSDLMAKPRFDPNHFQITKDWQIQRIGSARFGSGRVNDDQDR